MNACDVCGAEFILLDDLLLHKELEHEEEKYIKFEHEEKYIKNEPGEESIIDYDMIGLGLENPSSDLILCEICGDNFKTEEYLADHMSASHNVENVVNDRPGSEMLCAMKDCNVHVELTREKINRLIKEKKKKTNCRFCFKVYATAKATKRHEQECELNEAATPGPEFVCEICSSIIKRYDNFRVHTRNCKNRSEKRFERLNNLVITKNRFNNCLFKDCNSQFYCKRTVIRHLKAAHNSYIKDPLELRFTDMNDFLKWKEDEEEKTFSYFTKRNRSNCGRIYYYCQHDGSADLHSSRKTDRKRKAGSVKQGRVCIAMIRVVEEDSCIAVKYFPTHSHPLSIEDFKRQPQSAETYRRIDELTDLGYNAAEILKIIKEDAKCDGHENRVRRVEFLTRGTVKMRASRRKQHQESSIRVSSCKENQDVDSTSCPLYKRKEQTARQTVTRKKKTSSVEAIMPSNNNEEEFIIPVKVVLNEENKEPLYEIVVENFEYDKITIQI